MTGSRLRPRLDGPAGQFAAAAALLIAASAFLFWYIAQTAHIERDLEAVGDELVRLHSLSDSIDEFGKRVAVYAATGNEAVFREARRSRGEAVSELSELKRVAGLRPGWYEWVLALAPVIERRIELADRETLLRREKGAAAALADLRTGEAERLDVEIDRRLDQMQEDVIELRQMRRLERRQRLIACAAIFGFILALSLFLLAAAFRTLRREIGAHRETADKLLRAEQRERRRVSQVLHDSLQQTLAAAAMHLNLILTREKDDELRESAVSAAAILKEAVQTTRTLSYELCPPDIARGSLGRSLQWLAEQMRARHKLEVTVVVAQDPPGLPDPLRDFCLGAARELLFNVVKHAKTGAATLEVSSRDGRLRVEVSDGGTGFDPKRADALDRGLGLSDIRERVGLFGGRLEVDSRPSGGCRASLFVPFG